jgi:hypothetical protein
MQVAWKIKRRQLNEILESSYDFPDEGCVCDSLLPFCLSRTSQASKERSFDRWSRMSLSGKREELDRELQNHRELCKRRCARFDDAAFELADGSWCHLDLSGEVALQKTVCFAGEREALAVEDWGDSSGRVDAHAVTVPSALAG